MKTKLTIKESARLIELGIDAKLASEREFVDKTERDSNQFLEIEEYPRFTLTDILSILPKEIKADNVFGKRGSCPLTMEWWKRPQTWYTKYVGASIPSSVGLESELIDALNQLLIWLITNGHIKTEKE